MNKQVVGIAIIIGLYAGYLGAIYKKFSSNMDRLNEESDEFRKQQLESMDIPTE